MSRCFWCNRYHVDHFEWRTERVDRNVLCIKCKGHARIGTLSRKCYTCSDVRIQAIPLTEFE